MDKNMKIKPLTGLIVRDPITKAALSPDGEVKPFVGKAGTFWRRRLRDGSVVVVKNTPSLESKKEEVEITEIKKHKKGGKF